MVKSKIHIMARIAVMTALTCVLAPMTIPIGPVPITLTNLVMFFSLYLLGWKMGTVSVVVYILIGMLGVPVFSGFSGGLGKLLGPTGGYIIGYIPMAVIGGLAVEKFNSRWVHFLGLALGTAVLYALGTAWFCYTMKIGVMAALGQAVIPFIPFDLIKIVIVIIVGPMIRERLVKSGTI